MKIVKILCSMLRPIPNLSQLIWVASRAILSAGYFRIDYSIVWNVIEQDLPEIEPQISVLLAKMADESKEPVSFSSHGGLPSISTEKRG
ncbi:MAG TPA: DUF86 domain-containing protein [Methanoregula sp.]|nr:DUF86 domain-containing protein [Methanoregula sp.]